MVPNRFYRKIDFAPSLLEAMPNPPGMTYELTYADVDELYVDIRYQRNVGRSGRKVIRNILENFSWNKFQPICVARVEIDGRKAFAVIDGQHRAIAAFTHPMIMSVPVYVVSLEGFRAQAEVFSAVNRMRTSITPTELFYAELAAGNPAALALQAVCDRAEVIVQKTSSGGIKPRHFMAVAALRALVKKYGADVASRAMRALADGHATSYGQIRAHSIPAMGRFIAAYEEESGPVDMTILVQVSGSIDFIQASAEAVFEARSSANLKPIGVLQARIAKAYGEASEVAERQDAGMRK